MDQNTHQGTNSLLLQLLLEEVDDRIYRFEAQLRLKDTNRPASRLEEVELDRRVAFHTWKSEIERQRVIMSDHQIATTLSLGMETEEKPLPKKTKTFGKLISTTIQKLVRSIKRIMHSVKVLISANSHPQICSSCRDIYSEIFKTQCSHFYCKNCLTRMVTKSLENESLFPPQCCKKAIQGSGMKQMIGSALAQEQKKRKTELSDPDRTYCSDSTCSRYILPGMRIWRDLTFKRICTCECGVRTCRKCKNGAHGGKCLYRLDKSLEKLMKRKGWQRCNKCGRVIELEEGCPHITCVCRAQWCYHCGKKWKTCDC